MCPPMSRTIKPSKWRWTCCAERRATPPFRPTPRRQFITDLDEIHSVPRLSRTVSRPARCPLWVKSGHPITSASCPLYLRKRTSPDVVSMSALCRKQTFDCYSINSSALPDRGNDTLQRRHYAFQVTETYDTIIRTGRRAAIGVVSRDKSDRLRLKRRR